MTDMRTEHDSLGAVQVASEALWGAQTQRSLQNFRIGSDRFPLRFIYAFAIVKKAAALANQQLGKLSADRARLIAAVCDEILKPYPSDGCHTHHSGSGVFGVQGTAGFCG